MLLGFTNPDNDTNDFHQRVADQNIQSLEARQEEIRHAKNGFIGMLAGIVVGGVVGWLFLGPADNMNKERAIPVIRRSFTPAKVLPNDPGGMEIDNQDREIYHIVDNTPKPSGEVNIRPAPDMPKLVVENTLPPSEAMDSLVESIDGDDSLNKVETELDNAGQGNIKLATAELSAIKTNSREKVAIPEKIKDIEVTLQKSINSQKQKLSDGETEKALAEKGTKPAENQKTEKAVFAKGTWYAQIIASSSRKAVQSLWNNLSAKHTFLKSYPYEIEEIKAANGNTLYRLKVGVFKTREEAAALGSRLKKNQISSIIKQTTGKTCIEIITSMVIMDAKAQLKSTNLSIHDIAYTLNFTNMSFFGKYFKRYVGMSPQEYRNS